jgi:hypothetical protein
MRNSTGLAIASLFLTANLAIAQLAPGPDPITGTVNTAQTLATGTGNVSATGNLSLSNGSVAVTVTGNSILNNLGTIQNSSARAIRLNTASVTFTLNNGASNNSTASIASSADDAFQANVSSNSVTVNNYGTITSTGAQQALDLNAVTNGTTTVTNFATGIITSTGNDAVRPGVNGTVSNAGLINATPDQNNGSADGDDGIDARNNAGVQVTNSGTIQGRAGITGGDAALNTFAITVTNNNGGAISGVNGSGINIDGVFTGVVATITNNSGATIKGTWDGVSTNGDGDGIDVDGVLNLTNNGFIRGLGANGNGSDGFANGPDGVAAGGGTIVNEAGAEITSAITTGNATSSFGILIDNSSKSDSIAATNLTNRGLVKSDNGPAVVFISTFANTIANNAGGTISGAGTGAQGAAIQTGNGNDTVNNAGTVIGDNGFAIDLQGGNNTLNVLGGTASITGNISGGAGGTNSLGFNLGAGNSFSYAGTISNFSTVGIVSGTVTLSGDNTYSGNTTIGGGTLLAQNVTGSATGTSAVAVNSGGKLGGNGTVGSVTVNTDGILAPGNSAGKLNINGDYTQVSGGKLAIELGGTTPVTQYDQLAVSGLATISGTLDLTLVSGFLPSVGDTFQIITSGSATGNFTTINSSGFTVRSDVTNSGVVLTVTTVGTPSPTPTATPTATPGLVGNVSTRLPVGSGDNVLIEGFIVQGPAGSIKKIMVRAIGPSLLPFGISDALPNPTLEIRDGNNALIATNDDWKNTQVGGIIPSDQSGEINGSGLAPGNDLESAIIADLAPGAYTAVVAGVGNTTGTGVVDAYDMSAASPAKLANVATRGLIQPGDKLMIAGFIIQNGSVRAVVRAIGPSLSAFGINNALPDTTLQLKDQNGVTVIENDDWQSTQKAELESTSLQPSNNLEAAVVVNLPPGQYTAQVRGKPEATGIGVVQVYFLQ